MRLRDYQQRTIDQLYHWMRSYDGHPCAVLPTGAGKSVVIASLIRDALQEWPDTQALMLCHQKELIEQNAEKMRAIWPNAPLGIYSASVGKRQLGEPILFAGIQSIHRKAHQVGHIDICVIDECHSISHKDQGTYRRFIADLLAINPHMRIIGFTATPYRLGHGLITDEPAIFSGLVEPVTIEELIYKGHLAPLRSKFTAAQLDTSGVHKRGGEYIESELQAAVDTEPQNVAVVDEVIRLAEDRRAWLFFCTGVAHAEHVRDALQRRGIPAECVTGATPKTERERLLRAFKAGELRALTNANVLTTGFDYPDIDLIAMMRPTMSPGLYVQMAGRGMRPKSHTDHCLVLDFAGNVSAHGPITAVQPPSRSRGDAGGAPTRTCPECDEIVHAAKTECPACGFVFPIPEKPPLALRHDDIMGLDATQMTVTGWRWIVHTSRASGKKMLRVSYYGQLSDPIVNEYLTILHEGVAGQRAIRNMMGMAQSSGVSLAAFADQDGSDQVLKYVAETMSDARPPSMIEYRIEGKFPRIYQRSWTDEQATA